MKNLVLILLLALSMTAWAQNSSIEGKVVEGPEGTSLPGANVLIKGTSTGAIADIDGYFKIGSLSAGQYTLEVSFIGFETKEITTTLGEGENLNIGNIAVQSASIGLQEVEVIASYATDRKTPVAFSTISSEKIEARVGNQEFPEILRETPSVYVTKQGGGFGDARINVRGFDQRNTAVMINGIPVNDMENGWVYWSNWAGLTDIASNVQIQRGLGATKLAVASVGGSINIVTNAAESKKGGAASVAMGNDGYTKYGLSLSTGLSDKGWALTVQGTHTRGNGYADGTLFRAWSYFASVAKQINSAHSLHFTVLGAPQWHFQRNYGSFDGVTARTLMDLDEEDRLRYNPQWGYYGESDFKDNLFTWQKNFYHKPKAFLNHYWTVSDKTEVSTSAYVSLGRGGGTGDLGRINGSFRTAGTFKNSEGIARFDDIHTWNTGGTVADFGNDNVPWSGPGVTTFDPNYNGPFAGQNVAESYRNGMILRSSMNEHNWYGILTNLTHELNNKFTLVAGLDARYYKGLHYRRVEDLLGLDAYFDDDDVNEPVKYITDEGRADGNQIDYNNDGLVNWLGLFTQLEYSTDRLSAFASLSGSHQGFKRIDYFLYEDDDPEQESDWENILGGTVKGGLNYNISARHNVFANGGFFSRQPIFDNVFLNFTNEINPEIENQAIQAFELGYGYRSDIFSANFNLYHTYWGNRQISRSVRLELTDPSTNEPVQVDGNALFKNVNQLHQGVEVDFRLTPVRNLNINGMVSLGNWRYTENFTATWVPEETGFSSQTLTLFMEDVKVPDAAQTSFNLGATYEVLPGLKIYGNYYYADNLYADFDIATDDSFNSADNQAWKLPSYGLLDGGLSYKFTFGGVSMIANVNINNLLNETYFSESETNRLFNPENPNDQEIGENGSINNVVYYGFGRTWNAGLKVKF